MKGRDGGSNRREGGRGRKLGERERREEERRREEEGQVQMASTAVCEVSVREEGREK